MKHIMIGIAIFLSMKRLTWHCCLWMAVGAYKFDGNEGTCESCGGYFC